MADTQNVYVNEKNENTEKHNIRKTGRMGTRTQKNRVPKKGLEKRNKPDGGRGHIQSASKNDKNFKTSNRTLNTKTLEQRNNISKLNDLHKNTKSAKPVKKFVDDKETSEHILTEFILGEFEDKGKKLAFKKCADDYKIIDITDETEKVLNTYKESAEAYLEWCKIKYPDKIKKNLV